MKGPKEQTYLVRLVPLESTPPLSVTAERVRSELEVALEGSAYAVEVSEVEGLGFDPTVFGIV